ncbi:hypothetical protein FQN54_008676 [Arachnomyces sp. PD_36]|nr:hypothetical protein FQN54_008676 [Arachnomyces sp. PD_36]
MSTSTVSFGVFPSNQSCAYAEQKMKGSKGPSASMFDLSTTGSKPKKTKKDKEKKEKKAEKRKSMELIKTLAQSRLLTRSSQENRRDELPQECVADFGVGQYPASPLAGNPPNTIAEPTKAYPHNLPALTLPNPAESAERWRWFAKSRKSSSNSQAAPERPLQSGPTTHHADVAVESPSPRHSLYPSDPSDRWTQSPSRSSISGNVHTDSSKSTDPPVSASPLEAAKMVISASTASDATMDDDASSCYSRTSSTSSVCEDSEQEQQNKDSTSSEGKPYSLICPVDAGVFDESHMLRKFPTLRMKKSMSIKYSRNKPLPPEPPMEVSPLLIRGLGQDRHINVPPVPTIPEHDHSSPPMLQLSTVPSHRDIEALNSAFQRMMVRRPSQLRFDVHADSPTLDEAAKDLEQHLSSIPVPEPLITSKKPLQQHERQASDLLVQPLQISRGKMEMQPSRSPPQPTVKTPLLKSPKSILKKPGGSPPLDSTRAKSKSHRRHFSFSANSFGSKKSKSSLQSSGRSEKSNSPPSSSSKSETRNVSVESIEKPIVKVNPAPTTLATKACGVAKERNLRLQLLPRLKTDQLQSPSISNRSVSMDRSVSREPERIDEGSKSENHIVEIIKRKSQNGNMSINQDTTTTSPEDSIYSNVKNSILPAISNINVISQPESAEKELYVPGESEQAQVASYLPEGIAELDGGAPSPRTKLPQASDPIVSGITVDAAESIILGIMQNLDNLEDLFTTAILNRGFYQVFKNHELDLIKNTLFRMSPAAWELRQMSPPWGPECHDATGMDAPVPEYTPSLYLNYYSRDLYTMVALKSLILVRCESFLRQDTVNALAGLDEARAAEIDEAFWRVWTFCRIFGCGKNREDDIKGQMDWLNGGVLAEQQHRGTSMILTDPFGTNTVLFDPPEGFSQGNGKGLTAKELYDMTEVWTCLGVLLDGFHGKCDEARQFGVFDDSGVKEGDIVKEEAMLEEWTHYIQSLGPSAILTLATINPTDSTEATFARAQSLGWTSWATPGYGLSRTSFLKDAISRAYESRISKQESPEKRSGSPQPNSNAYFPAPPARPGRLSDQSDQKKLATDFRERRAALAEELQQKNNEAAQKDELPQIKIGFRRSTFVDERPLSKYHEVMKRFEPNGGLSPRIAESPLRQTNRPVSSSPSQSESPLKQFERPENTTPRFEPTACRSPRQFEPTVGSSLRQTTTVPPAPHAPQVRDPVDVAMSRMVDDLGFSREDSKRALKATDSGDKINVDAAVMMLVQERRKDDPALRQLELELGVDMDSMNTFSNDALDKIRNSPGWRWA